MLNSGNERMKDLDNEQLAKLMGMAVVDKDSQTAEPADSINYLLHGRMGEILPFFDSGDDLAVLTGRTIGQMLLDPRTDLNMLDKIKDYGKSLARREISQEGRTAGTLIYSLAIASAIVYHERRITSHSYERLDQFFAETQAKPWLPAELAEHFAKAREICRAFTRKE